MQIKENISFHEWNEIASCCEYATFFQTATWFKIFEDSFPDMKIKTNVFISKKGKIILPTISNKYESFFGAAGVYGGWISANIISDDEKKYILQWIKKNFRNFTWRINPFEPNNHIIKKNFKFRKNNHDFTQIISVDQDFEYIWKNYSKGHRYNIKRAEGTGIDFRIAKTEEDYKKYFLIYQDSIKRWGSKATNKYEWKLFSNFYKNQKENKNIKLWLATFENKIISGALVLYNNQHAVWWHGATLSDFLKYYPSNYLQNIIIKDAAENKKIKYYDFNPSGGHQGVIKFKKNFDAKKINCEVIIQKNHIRCLKEYLKKCLKK